jgi:DNA polymerase III subunit epsilon
MNTAEALEIVAAQTDYRLLRRVPENLPEPAEAAGETGLALIVDTETTGMDKRHDKIIEVGLLLVRYRREDGRFCEVVGQYSGLEDPGVALNDVVKTVTGLTDAELSGQHMDDACVLALLDQADLVIAHNAAFDRPFLERRWPSFGEKSFACSINEIDWMDAGFTSAKLELLVYHCGYFYDSHRALNDCWALLFMLRQPVGAEARPAMAELLARAAQPSFLLNLQVRFDDKDKLKALGGFQWVDGSDARFMSKSWLRRCRDKAELRSVLEAIQAEVFGGAAFPCEIGKLTAMQRYALDPQGIAMRPYTFPG